MKGNVSERDEDWFVISMEMTLELVDPKALKFKLNEIEQRYWIRVSSYIQDWILVLNYEWLAPRAGLEWPSKSYS